MERTEGAISIEKANHDGGLKSAYQAFSDEVNKISQTATNQGDADQKIHQLTDTLEKDGLLPGISAYWAKNSFGLFDRNGEANKQDLAAFVDRKSYDKVAFTLGQELQNQYGMLSGKTWLNDNLNTKDMDITLQEYADNRKKLDSDDTAKKTADILKRDNWKLFDKIASIDGDSSSVSVYDLYQAQSLSKIVDTKEGSLLSADDAKVLQNLDPYALSDLAHTNGYLTKDALSKVTYDKHPWDASPPADTTAKAPVVIPAVGKGISKALIDTADAAQKAPALDQPTLDAIRQFIESKGLHMNADKVAQMLNQKVAEVHDGDGYDRIARRELRKLKGDDVSEAEVLEYSDQIAKFNGQTGGRLNAKVNRNLPIMLPEYKQAT